MINLEDVADVLSLVQVTGSTLQKQSILKRYESLEGLKEVLKFIFDPYFVTGLGDKKLNRVDMLDIDVTVEEMMDYLKKNNTGTDYDAMLANAFIYRQPTDNAEWLARALVTKDLQIGVSITTLNKVYGDGFIPKIGIMRGMLCPEKASGIYIATEKIDGNRRLIMNKPTGVEIYTRSGHRDYGLVEIAEQAKQLPVGYVFDCECIAIGDFADSIELRQASASILNSRTKIKRNVMACVFDALPQADYDAGRSRMGALGRKAMIAGLFNDGASIDLLEKYFIKYDESNGYKTNFANSVNALCRLFRGSPACRNIMALPILGIVHNKQEGIELAKPIWETGGEGVMMVEYRSAYEVNPNPRPTLLKIKATKEYTCRCVDVVEGDNKYTGTLGAIVVRYRRPSDPVDYLVKVGSGFADYQRDLYWRNPQRIIGKMVELESFGESRNADGGYSLNCPIFKRIVGEND